MEGYCDLEWNPVQGGKGIAGKYHRSRLTELTSQRSSNPKASSAPKTRGPKPTNKGIPPMPQRHHHAKMPSTTAIVLIALHPSDV